MGAGKSTIARALAKKCPSKRIEMDQLIEEQQGMAITDIFAAHGENYFRDLETELLRSFSESTGYVVSCGGGSVLRDENAALMKENGCIVFLRATPETIYERVKDSTNRPILNGNMNVEYIRELMEKRRPRYEAVADICVDTDGKDVDWSRMNFRRCMIMFCRNWSVRSIIIGENRRSAASFCARRQSGSAGFIIPTIKSVIRRTLRWKSFCVIRTKMSTT